MLRSSSGAVSVGTYLDQGNRVNDAGLAGGTLYRCGTIGMKKFTLVEMWKKYLQSVREMDGMKSDKIGSECLGEGIG